MVIQWIMVAHVDSSDCRCRCIGKIIARDFRLVASRLYKTGGYPALDMSRAAVLLQL